MSQNKLIVSNWKMNLNIKNSMKIIKNMVSLNLPKLKNCKNIICPQFLLIPKISEIIKGRDIILGSQDCHYEEEGAFTGDSSIEMIKTYNCKYSIIGHSERRHYYNERNENIYKKASQIQKNKLIPIICIGESLDQRKKNNHLNVLSKQIIECIPKDLKDIVIAYEPIWSIGTGVTPSSDEILEVINFIKKFLKKNKFSNKFSILYGGSVNSSNIDSIISISKADGVLIGGASIDINEISKILSYFYFN
ncbi:MAG: triose-phosphate isomerase [Rickettsiales bacterium]|nr:triose-phosphate isomerase [Rickettsiales bacterium]